MLIPPVINSDSRIDFYAGSIESFQHLKSLYDALPPERRGAFYASPSVIYLSSFGIDVKKFDESDNSPLVVADYRDLNVIFYTAEDRPLIMFEREYSKDVRGLLKTVTAFLCMDRRVYDFRRISSPNVFYYETIADISKALLKFIKGKTPKHIDEINGKSVGLLYMSFGSKAPRAIRQSIASLERLGISYPVAIVGDAPVDNHIFQQWEGVSPFDSNKKRNFQFRAGKVKPALCSLSPFDYTLYIDADTRFIKSIHDGFEYLKEYDVCVTQEILMLKDLYNKKMAGWEINLLERDATIIELDNNPDLFFINSGVIFFRKNTKTLKLFSDWYIEWSRFQEWDEQLALMRAIHANEKVKVKSLPVEWNSPHYKDETIIFHNYGRGSVRTNL